jgi:putative glutathione S-transferase
MERFEFVLLVTLLRALVESLLTKWKPIFCFVDKDAKFPAEKDRYHLFVAYACPWAHRSLMTRALKGLEDVITVTVVHPVWKPTRPGVDEHAGWVFGDANGEPMTNVIGEGGPFPPAYPGNEPEPFFNAKDIRELYERAGDKDGKYTVPILWDKKQNTIVRYVGFILVWFCS